MVLGAKLRNVKMFKQELDGIRFTFSKDTKEDELERRWVDES